MIVDMRLRPPIPSWVGQAQFSKGGEYYPSRIGFPRPPSAEERSMPLLMEEMEQAGVTTGVVMGRKSAEPFGRIDNGDIAEAIDSHADRLVAFIGLDVADSADENVAEIQRWHSHPRFVGVSIEPGASMAAMAPDDPRIDPIYETARDLGLPLSIGLSNMLCTTIGNAYELSSPLPLSRVAKRFPDLKIIVSHGAWPWVQEVLGVSFAHPNIWLSPDLYMVGTDIPGAELYIRAARHFMGERLLFGTAYPSRPLAESVAAFDDWGLDDDLKAKILGLNAARLLGLAEE